MMKTPPKMLSPKDCSYLADLLETLLTTAKKAEDYSQKIEDQQVSDFAAHYYETLKSQYSILTDELIGSGKQPSAAENIRSDV